MTKMQEIRAAREAYQAKKKSTGKEAVAEELKELFDAHPELVAIRWTGYTPHFNDGDPCVFRLGEVHYKTSSTPDDAGDDEDGFDYVPYGNEEPLYVALNDFDAGREKDIYLECFGDHVQVTATRDGVTVEEYEHD